MRAYELTRFGGPEVLRFGVRSEPLPGPREVVVGVRAIGLNPIDVLQRSGAFRFADPMRFPVVPGNEFSGVVSKVGREVTSLSVGDAVFGRTDKARLGALAEQVAIEERLAARTPGSLDFVSAAAVPLAGTTALQAIRDALEVRAGDRLLITGGSSMVGMFAIQLAARVGAQVTTTASAESRSLLRHLGADEVVDYRTQAIDTGAQLFDKVFDLVGERLPGVVARDGRLVTVSATPTPGSIRHDYPMAPWRALLLETALGLATFGARRQAHKGGYAYRFLSMLPSGDDLRELGSLIDDGALRVKVDSTYDFTQATEAFARVESRRAKGKVVLVLS